MKEINFYCIEEDINGFLYNFLSKLVEKNKRVFIYSENMEKMEKLDNILWTLKKVDFLDSFEKTFYIFSPINQSIIENVKNNWNKYKKIGFHEKLLKKDNDGKWKEYSDFII